MLVLIVVAMTTMRKNVSVMVSTQPSLRPVLSGFMRRKSERSGLPKEIFSWSLCYLWCKTCNHKVMQIFLKNFLDLFDFILVVLMGLIFDWKLNFLSDTSHLKTRFISSTNLLKVPSNTDCRSDKTVILRLYRYIYPDLLILCMM